MPSERRRSGPKRPSGRSKSGSARGNSNRNRIPDDESAASPLPTKKKGLPLAFWVVAGLAGVALLFFIYSVNTRRERVVVEVEDPNKDINFADKMLGEGQAAMRSWRQAQEQGNQSEAMVLWREAKEKLSKARDMLYELQDEHMDENGNPEPGYEYLEEKIFKVNEYLSQVVHDAPVTHE